MPTRILSIDGGGIKGIVSVKVLVRLERLLQDYTGDSKTRIADYFDLIGGTSTGAIVAALLLCPGDDGRPRYSAEEIMHLYLYHGNKIFKKRTAYPINTLFGLIGSKYNNVQFHELLTQYFGDIRLKDLLKPCLLTSYITVTRRAVFFNTLSMKNSYTTNYYVKDIVLASTAAPTYFPPMTIENEYSVNNCYIDGGVFANNPALCTLIEALKLPRCDSLQCIQLLSIGNVSSPKSYMHQNVRHWGLAKWALPMFNILMDGSEQTVDYQIKKIFHGLGMDGNYLRADLTVTDTVPPMDDVREESIRKLLEYGDVLADKMDKKMKLFIGKQC